MPITQKRIHELEAALVLAQEALKDRDDDTRTVLAEECAGDEKHCSCVPILRRELARKDRVIEALACGMVSYGRVLAKYRGGTALTTMDAVLEWAGESADHAEAKERAKDDKEGK